MTFVCALRKARSSPNRIPSGALAGLAQAAARAMINKRRADAVSHGSLLLTCGPPIIDQTNRGHNTIFPISVPRFAAGHLVIEGGKLNKWGNWYCVPELKRPGGLPSGGQNGGPIMRSGGSLGGSPRAVYPHARERGGQPPLQCDTRGIMNRFMGRSFLRNALKYYYNSRDKSIKGIPSGAVPYCHRRGSPRGAGPSCHGSRRASRRTSARSPC